MMKKIFLIASLIVMLASCGNKQQATDETFKEPNEFLAHFVDSASKAYPNFYGNGVIAGQITKELEERIKAVGVEKAFENIEFYIVREVKVIENYATGEKYNMVMLHSLESTVEVVCENISQDEATKLTPTKYYKVTGGKVVSSQAPMMNDKKYIQLGGFTLEGLTVEEIPGKEVKFDEQGFPTK